MRAVLTRVKSASVTIDGETVGKIGKGFLILLGVGPNDTEKECRYLAEKALSLRIFEDENGKMNLGLDAVEGQVLVVSQFTLFGNCRKGAPQGAFRQGPARGKEYFHRQIRGQEFRGAGFHPQQAAEHPRCGGLPPRPELICKFGITGSFAARYAGIRNQGDRLCVLC